MSRSTSFNQRQLFSLIRLLIRYPKLAALGILLLGGCNYAYEVKVARPPMLYEGEPKAIVQSSDTWFRVLRNHGFILGYSDVRGNPLWVEYALTPVPKDAPAFKRPGHFVTDWRSLNRISHESYQQSGYDRGHMAPNYAMGHLYGKAGQADSFLMTNITPQTANLNRKVWERLEEVEIDAFAPRFGKIWVVTGPIFSGGIERLRSDWKVEIPDAFYKIYLTAAQPPAKPLALAFIIPQTVGGTEPLAQFVASIDSIETQTGLDFFADLDDAVENALEADVDGQPWHLQEVSQLPPRY